MHQNKKRHDVINLCTRKLARHFLVLRFANKCNNMGRKLPFDARASPPSATCASRTLATDSILCCQLNASFLPGFFESLRCTLAIKKHGTFIPCYFIGAPLSRFVVPNILKILILTPYTLLNLEKSIK